MFSAKLMINNEAVDADDGATFERIDPLTGDVATIASAGSPADMARAANAAAAAFPDWSQTGPGERRRLLNAA
ncbi:aldehyde dehydrogenase family protein, partial [Pseudomonas sp. BGM005]|nr:aldehyde dehydrogenase family protein [Pseudomonas sp. BG5]